MGTDTWSHVLKIKASAIICGEFATFLQHVPALHLIFPMLSHLAPVIVGGSHTISKPLFVCGFLSLLRVFELAKDTLEIVDGFL